MLPLMLGMVLMVLGVLIIHRVCASDSVHVDTSAPVDFSDSGDTGADLDSDGTVGGIGAGNVHSTGCTGGSSGDSVDGAGGGSNGTADGLSGDADNYAKH